MTIDEFIEKCHKRPLPSNPMARVKVLARELAEGAANKLWSPNVNQFSGNKSFGSGGTYVTEIKHIRDKYKPHLFSEKYFTMMTDNRLDTISIVPMFQYFHGRWIHEDEMPALELLDTLKYIELGKVYFNISEKAFNLLEEADPATIFISYKRSESSAFALLLEDRLTYANLSPFLDKQLQAGDDWHAELEQKIANSDYFIIILSKKTLESDITIKEIDWALQYEKTIIPIWHNGFEFKVEDWPKLPAEISKGLANTHTIRVIEENPLTYDTALRELLNRFGISG